MPVHKDPVDGASTPVIPRTDTAFNIVFVKEYYDGRCLVKVHVNPTARPCV